MPFPIFDIENKRNLIISLIAGIIFFSGWWIFIDAAIAYTIAMGKHRTYFLPGVFGTISMIVVNVTPYRTSRDDLLYNTNKCSPVMTLAVLFVGLVVSFGTFIWSFYILIADFILSDAAVWTGVGVTLQNACILASNLLLKFSKEIQNDV